ncbi:YbaB/EbfC family nucleoid-associated protein [Paractinoplanes hotanensis]|uniref:YbaB/EbfC family nucleoid-associated protein n=1 Tax=Paractinoplanes hotanensis TaxID=2906497 RepID=A0ABT0YBU5_9ACTN|nr:YbaB/EbfC family nucleoid-associated protein [Actinoplanes hotanensis]MCM4082937.1 YbaB/EbfC family nucleoid-associated protein [Actinoplanes hotanensis]
MAVTANRDANRELRDRLAEVHERYARLRSDLDGLQQRLDDVRVTVVSNDGLVRVTVGPRGELIDLRLIRRATRNMDNEYVSRTIVTTVHTAAERAAERVQTLMADYLPPDSGALRYLRDHNFGSLLGRSDEIVQDLAGRDE